MKSICVVLAVSLFVLLTTSGLLADQNTAGGALNYINKVFNDRYDIEGNSSIIENTLRISSCKLVYSYKIDGSASETQSCMVSDLDQNNIHRGRGNISIGTINNERKVTISTIRHNYWYVTLNYNDNLYPEGKVISSLKAVIQGCK